MNFKLRKLYILFIENTLILKLYLVPLKISTQRMGVKITIFLHVRVIRFNFHFHLAVWHLFVYLLPLFALTTGYLKSLTLQTYITYNIFGIVIHSLQIILA